MDGYEHWDAALCLWIIFLAVTTGVCLIKTHLEETVGETATIHLEIAELDKADQVRITHTRESEKKKLIVQYCSRTDREDCNAVETAGVLLQVKEGALILLNVSSKDSGLYEVTVIRRNNTSEIQQTTLVVNKRVSSRSEPPQIPISKPPQSISKPPNSSERQRTSQKLMLKQPKKPLLSPDMKLLTSLCFLRPSIFKKK
ncbi:hypothetical protein Q8A67_017000 [Cirrhinus molitorella]|uniref:Uncharacterized protein n=1 Tax=Cirrhinus molitorella TaxID=172907 RepID=A0AA88PKJ0_9TELE|nr:hypothetical protein Q8A67_017000 [Cirrhinus molitorella]